MGCLPMACLLDERVAFPEFFKQRFLDKIKMRAFSGECWCDMIIGRDVVSEMGVKLDFKKQLISWDEVNIDISVFPQASKDPQEPTPAEAMFLDMAKMDLEDDMTDPGVATNAAMYRSVHCTSIVASRFMVFIITFCRNPSSSVVNFSLFRVVTHFYSTGTVNDRPGPTIMH